ncbi:hypothetical protein M426DRAFT_17878 [Hypoxylon sp. CI-4A]|nr:hypothetical protein M426DRAFT_17878 [Hypoxylon sp. CI-4A]
MSSGNVPMNLKLEFLGAMVKAAPGLAQETIFTTFNGLYSSEIFAGADADSLNQPEARFASRLIVSVTNSFSGLQNMPRAGILNFLSRHCTFQSMIDLLMTLPKPITKAFAENAFPTYIETDDVKAVEFLLSSNLVDENTMTHYLGEPYTPLEYAAVKQSLLVLQLFIRRRFDVNKTFRRSCDSNALHLLVGHMNGRRLILDDGLLSLVDAFLGAGVTVLIGTIQIALHSFVDTRLAVRLIENTADQAPEALVLDQCILADIIKHLEKPDATRFLKLVMDKYREFVGTGSLFEALPHLGNALNAIVSRGYNDLFQMLLLHSSSPMDLFRVAMDASTGKFTSPIKRADLYTTRGLGLDHETEITGAPISDLIVRYMSTYASRRRAIKESQDHNIGLALTEALKAGNLESVRRILDLDPDFKSYNKEERYPDDDSTKFDVSRAMSAALDHGFDDIAWRLMDFGFTTATPSFRLTYPDPLIHVAVKHRRPEFMKAILNFGCSPSVIATSHTLELALKYNEEDSMFDTLWDARPSVIYASGDLYRMALKKGGEELFFDILNSSERHSYDLDIPLKVAVEHESELILDKLISLGARANNSNALEIALLEDHPTMISPLLKHFWKAYPQGCAGYGYNIILGALQNSRTSQKLLKKCFHLGLVAMNATSQATQHKASFLIKAIDTLDCKLIGSFVDAGSNVNNITIDANSHRGFAKTTPLLYAIEKGDLEIVKFLIDRGANVNVPTGSGIQRTPLQKAAELDNLPILQLLLDNNAEVNAAPAIFGGATALQFAAIHGNYEMATSLIKHGARQDVSPSGGRLGRWPLEGAAENGRIDMIQLLWKTRSEPFDHDQCQRAMQLAESNGYIGCKEMIEMLMADDQSSNRQIHADVDIMELVEL